MQSMFVLNIVKMFFQHFDNHIPHSHNSNDHCFIKVYKKLLGKSLNSWFKKYIIPRIL
jgi:hypothetical protein